LSNLIFPLGSLVGKAGGVQSRINLSFASVIPWATEAIW
jgi:hypothetical protein